MGLTIHYLFKARGSDARARRLINSLHQAAQDLPFKKLGEIVEWSHQESDSSQRVADAPLNWLIPGLRKDVEIISDRRVYGGKTHRAYVEVAPIRMIAFTAWPGPGCESTDFGLCQYPVMVERSGQMVRTRLSGWRWGAYCKTEYAGNPDCGGVHNFVQCHLTLIAMLDKAKELGCLEEVDDEGGFWEKRELQTLVAHIGSGHDSRATFDVDSQSLEAAGFDKLGQLIGRVHKPAQPEGAAL